MNRVIAFRIWDKHNKKMIESGATPSMLSLFFEKTAALNVQDGMPYLQFTGLLDKNGVKIFEGDVVNVDYNHIGKQVVVFENGAFCVAGYDLKRCEVVGNVFQSPELIGAQNAKTTD